MLDNLKKYQIILASNSPRRKELMSGLGVDYVVRTLPDVDESYPDTLAGAEIPEFIAREKADAYRAMMKSGELLVTADTIVWLDGQVLGKPEGREGAVEMLRALSGKSHQAIAWEIEKINQQFLNEGKNYVLVGPGRWGSSDTWLGIPVKWPHISAARVIVEAGLTNYRVDPSQGTHFFQNLTSFGVGYFTINAFMNDGVYNQEFLNAQPAVEETKFLRHVRFEKPMVVKMDGKKKLGVVLMPGV